MKSKATALLLMVALIPAASAASFTVPDHAAAAVRSAKVSLPSFRVTLNGQVVDNSTREYPLLVYKDITYVPMTWYDSRMLGLEATWSEDNGLQISEAPVTASYHPYSSGSKNRSSYTAEVPASAVTVNGEHIDNANEPYPLLSFRDVTYFPLTWRFAHDAFGWDYSWDADQGLSIRSDNLLLQDTGLPSSAAENGLALYKEHYYFVETDAEGNRQIYRAPVTEPGNKKEVYRYTPYANDMAPRVNYQIRDDGLWLVYHLGGVTMGSDHYVRLSDTGENKEAFHGYLDFQSISKGTAVIRSYAPPSGGNLYLESEGADSSNRKELGSSSLLYSGNYQYNGDHYGGMVLKRNVRVGNDLYVLAGPYPTNDYSDQKLYKVSLDTGESKPLTAFSVSAFRIVDQVLYYVKTEDHKLYRSKLDGTAEKALSDYALSADRDWFDVLEDGNVYYTSTNADYQQHLYKAEAPGADRLALPKALKGVYAAGNQLICLLADGETYGAVILNDVSGTWTTVAEPVSRVVSNPMDSSFLLVTPDNRVLRGTGARP